MAGQQRERMAWLSRRPEEGGCSCSASGKEGCSADGGEGWSAEEGGVANRGAAGGRLEPAAGSFLRCGGAAARVPGDPLASAVWRRAAPR